jgi:RND family efflux transporter MFP subunit
VSKTLRSALVSFGILAVCSLFAAAILAFGRGDPPAALATPPAQRVAVRTTTVVPANVQRSVLAFGTVEAKRDALLAVETDGSVTALMVNLGAKVAADSALVRVDDREQAITLQQGAAELARAKAIERRARVEAQNALRQLGIARETLATRERECVRWRDLAGRQMASQDRLDQAEVMLRNAKASHARVQGTWDSVAAVASETAASVAVAQASRDRAALNRARCVVRAPFTGRVAERLVEVGDYVRRGTPVLRLVSHEHVRLRVHVGAEDALTIAQGARVTISVPGVALVIPTHHPEAGAAPGQQTPSAEPSVSPGQIPGRVEGVAAAADAGSRKFAVDIEAENPLGLLRDGMFARVRVDAGVVADALLIPDESVGSDSKGHFVYVVVEDRVKKTRLVLGPRQGEGRILRSGLTGPVELVSDGLGLLFDGAQIRRMGR